MLEMLDDLKQSHGIEACVGKARVLQCAANHFESCLLRALRGLCCWFNAFRAKAKPYRSGKEGPA